MGLFSKKIKVCKKCGKEYECRIDLTDGLCKECYDKELKEKIAFDEQIGGYKKYNKDLFGLTYSEDELKAIISHKDEIQRKYKLQDTITKDELKQISYNYKNMSDVEISETVRKVKKLIVSTATGSAYNGNFFIPTGYDNTIVDCKDVFAVGFTNYVMADSISRETILCVIFTNDKYIPVIPMVFEAKLGFFELTKSRKGREGVTALFSLMCANLQYPVTDLKQLKKTIKNEDAVRGQMEKETMLSIISAANAECGIFSAKNLNNDLGKNSKKMIEDLGYICEKDVVDIFELGNLLGSGRFWTKAFGNN